MEDKAGLDSDEEYDLDRQLLEGKEIPIRFSLPQVEVIEPRRKARVSCKRKMKDDLHFADKLHV